MSGLFEAFERIQLSSHNRMGIDIDTEGWAMDGSSGFFVAEHKQTLVFDADQDGDMDVLWVTGARTMYTNSGPQQEKQPNFLLKNNGTGWFYTPDEEELVWPDTLSTSSAAVAGGARALLRYSCRRAKEAAMAASTFSLSIAKNRTNLC